MGGQARQRHGRTGARLYRILFGQRGFDRIYIHPARGAEMVRRRAGDHRRRAVLVRRRLHEQGDHAHDRPDLRAGWRADAARGRGRVHLQDQVRRAVRLFPLDPGTGFHRLTEPGPAEFSLSPALFRAVQQSLCERGRAGRDRRGAQCGILDRSLGLSRRADVLVGKSRPSHHQRLGDLGAGLGRGQCRDHGAQPLLLRRRPGGEPASLYRPDRAPALPGSGSAQPDGGPGPDRYAGPLHDPGELHLLQGERRAWRLPR